jgi:hypothetical protein
VLPQLKARQSICNRFNTISLVSFATIGKYLRSAIAISVLTMIGIRYGNARAYGMTIFMAVGSLLMEGIFFHPIY